MRLIDRESQTIHEVDHHGEEADGRGQNAHQVSNMKPAGSSDQTSTTQNQSNSRDDGKAAKESIEEGGDKTKG